MLNKFSLFISLIILFVSHAYAQQIAHGVATPFPGFYTEDGKGLFLEIYKEVYSLTDITPELNLYPPARSLNMIRTGSADIYVGVDQNTTLNVVYSKYPIWKSYVSIISNKTISWEDIKDLRQYRGIKLRGFQPEKNIDTELSLDEITDHYQAHKLLKSDRAQYFITADELVTTEMRQSMNVTKVAPIKVYLAFANTERGHMLKSKWDDAFPDFYKSGKLKKLYEKYDFIHVFQFTEEALNTKH